MSAIDPSRKFPLSAFVPLRAKRTSSMYEYTPSQNR